MREVAAEVGVSVATVSNAYNRPDQLSGELREKIMAAAEKLGFSGPDPFGRGLRRGKAGAIGVLYTDRLSYAFTDPAAVMFLEGVALAAEKEGLGMLLLPGGPIDERDREAVVGAAVDGMVVYCVADNDPLLRLVLQRNIPSVFVDLGAEFREPAVGIDDERGARQLAEHLVELGHKKFAVISFWFNDQTTNGITSLERQGEIINLDTRARLSGYRQVLEDAGIDWTDVPVYEIRENNPEQGRLAAAELLDAEDPPTAIFAMSDQLAFGVMEAAREWGLDVPEDLSVVGFDDVPESTRSNPPLTTIHQPHVEKGKKAGERLISIIAGEDDVEEETEVLPIELVVRESTSPPAG